MKPCSPLTVAWLILAMCISVPAIGQAVPLLNGGFEELGDDGRISDWSEFGPKTGQCVPEAAHTGKLGMLFVPTEKQQWIRQETAGCPSRAYLVSGWFKADGLKFGPSKDQHARLYVHVHYEGRPYSETSQFYRDIPPGTYDWRKFTVRIVPKLAWPISKVWVTVTSQFEEGKLYYDDVAIDEARSMGGASVLDWIQGANPIVLTDMSKCEPQSALADRRLKGKWKVLDYEAGQYAGNMLSANMEAEAPPVSLSLNADGWHAIYVGLLSGEVKLKLSGDPAYVARTKTSGPIDEVFFKAADLTGQDLQLAQQSKGTPQECQVMYVKLVPLTDEEVAEIQKDRANVANRRLATTIDGFSYIYGKGPTTAEDLLEEIESYRDSDFGTLYLQMTGADFVNYESELGVNLGTRDGELIPVFPRAGDRVYAESLQERIRNGVNATKIQIEGAKAIGMKVFASVRPAAWQYAPPMEEFFTSPFYRNHPEWRCVDRDGAPVVRMSYAVPEVRKYIIDILREAVAFGADGACVLYNRGIPNVLWEDAFCDLFRAKHDADAREVPEDDPRITELRVEVMTQFMREIREMLDEEAARRGDGKRLGIAAMVMANEADNVKYGIDIRKWIADGLLDEVAPYLRAGGSTAREYDLSFFAEVCNPKAIPWRPTIVAWQAPEVRDMMELVLSYYKGGASGVTFWDGNSLATRTDNWTVVTRLGHVDDIGDMLDQGAPVTNTLRPHRIGEFIMDGRYSINWGF